MSDIKRVLPNPRSGHPPPNTKWFDEFCKHVRTAQFLVVVAAVSLIVLQAVNRHDMLSAALADASLIVSLLDPEFVSSDERNTEPFRSGQIPVGRDKHVVGNLIVSTPTDEDTFGKSSNSFLKARPHPGSLDDRWWLYNYASAAALDQDLAPSLAKYIILSVDELEQGTGIRAEISKAVSPYLVAEGDLSGQQYKGSQENAINTPITIGQFRKMWNELPAYKLVVPVRLASFVHVCVAEQPLSGRSVLWHQEGSGAEEVVHMTRRVAATCAALGPGTNGSEFVVFLEFTRRVRSSKNESTLWTVRLPMYCHLLELNAQRELARRARAEWTTGSFAEVFPELERYGRELRRLTPAEVVVAIENELEEVPASLSIAGVELDGRGIRTWGPMVLVCLQLYMILHLGRCKWYIAMFRLRPQLPWLMIYDNRMSSAVLLASLVVAPAVAGLFVAGPHLVSDTAVPIVAVFAGLAAPILALGTIPFILSMKTGSDMQRRDQPGEEQ